MQTAKQAFPKLADRTHQTSFSQAEFAAKKKTTRREKFLARLEEVIPWAKLLAVIEPFYPKGERGRPPVGLERMLRVYFLQQWYGLADEAREDALYDSQALRGFARIDLAAEGVPDATTLLKFRRWLETHDLCQSLFAAINADLSARGLLLREGTRVDATLIAAPSSTKNKEKKRAPEMHQTKKGQQWYFGMKASIGADRDRKLVHTVVVTAANVADITKTAQLLPGQEKQVHADTGYTGVAKRAEIVALDRPMDWPIAGKHGPIKRMVEGAEKEALKAVEKAKALVRAFVEHPFHILNNLFRHRKVRYRGLAKNGQQLYTLFGLANVVIGARAART
ncbi:MAG: IS5 family transposase [Verrucomicrobia bacterium]|nr:IS5 family transposase [Verrucomicrobiota bacterium]